MNKFLKTEKEITKWLDNHGVRGYALIPDEQYGFVVNVVGNVYLSNENLTHIHIKFNTINGYLNCYHNKLSSLELCPVHVGKHFSCDRNNLTSREFCPSHVGGGFYCDGNELLGEVQDITDFQQIYELHREIVIAQQHHKLNEKK